jgi:hypothetical protein
MFTQGNRGDDLVAEATLQVLERQAERMLVRQQAQADTAKLLVTFAAGIASALVASALQVGPTSSLDIAATATLGVALLAAIAVLALDRLVETDRDSIMGLAFAGGWSQERLQDELRRATLIAEVFNRSVVRTIRSAAIVQIIFTVASACLACLSLLYLGVA